MMSNPEYNAEIAEWLKGIAPGWRVVNDICRPENLELFVDAVKTYIDNGGDRCLLFI